MTYAHPFTHGGALFSLKWRSSNWKMFASNNCERCYIDAPLFKRLYITPIEIIVATTCKSNSRGKSKITPLRRMKVIFLSENWWLETNPASQCKLRDYLRYFCTHLPLRTSPQLAPHHTSPCALPLVEGQSHWWYSPWSPAIHLDLLSCVARVWVMEITSLASQS